MPNQRKPVDAASITRGKQLDLQQLIEQTCQHPPGSLERNRKLTRLILAIQASGKLWQERIPYYEEALQQTWIYLCRNLCEACTGRQYDPERAAITTWLDAYLKRRLQDFRIQEYEERTRRANLSSLDEADKADAIAQLPAPPNTPPMLEETLHWIETDPTGELSSTAIKERPDLTCQVLMLRRFPGQDDSWKTLEVELNCSTSTMANFYQRQCVPRLRKFAESQGYLS